MPINFDPNSLNSVFDKNFGTGSFNAGLSNAKKAAQLKTQSGFAKQNFLKAVSEYQAKLKQDQTYMDKYGMTKDQYDAQQAQKKANSTFDSALNYWSDKKKDLQNKGAYKTANDLLNDPQAIENLKNQGYDVSKLVDAAYQTASNGQFKSKKAYDQYATALDKSNTNKKANQDSIDVYIQKAKQAEVDKKEQQKKTTNAKQMNFYDKLNAGGQRIGDQFLRTVFGDNFANWNNQQDKELAQYELKKNPNNTNAIKALIRDNAAYSKASTTGEKLLNYTGGTAGNILPFLVGDGLLGAAEKGIAGATKGTAQKALTRLVNHSTAVSNPFGKAALRGAASGIVGSGVNMSAHNVMSGETYTPQQVALNTLLSGAMGAVIPPALMGAGKGFEAVAGKTMKGLLPKNQDVANVLAAGMKQEPLGLPAPKLQLPPPQEVTPSIQELLSMGKQPGGLNNPIPQIPNVVNKAIQKQKLQDAGIGFGSNLNPNARLPIYDNYLPKEPRTAIQNQADNVLNDASMLQGKPSNYYEQRLLDVQKEMQQYAQNNRKVDPWVNFAQSSKSEPKARFNTSPIERASSLDPLHRSQTYWKSRYYDFAKEIQSKYHSNDLSEEKLQALWVKFAKSDEPKSLNDVVDLAYGNGSAGLKNTPFNAEQRMNDIMSGSKTDTSAGIKLPPSRNIEEIYQAVRKPGDPATFDELVRMNQLESNATQNSPVQGPREANIKDFLASDPRISEGIKALFPPKAPERPISRLATLDEMVQRLEGMAPPKQTPKVPEPLQFRVPKGYNPNLGPKILNRDVPGKNVSNSPLFLKASSLKSENLLKTVQTSKTLDVMSKDELQTVYKQLEDKKASLTAKKASKKQIAKVEEDMKKVNDFLLKSDLQKFGKTEKKSTVQPQGIKPQRPVKQQKAIEAQRQKKLVEDYKKKKNDVKAEIAGMLKNSDNWKDKGSFALGRETMSRNFEDVMGKDAGAFKKKFLDPISSQEAERVRFLNNEREWAKSHEIKPKSEEDKLVQMYGEKKISLDELKQKTSNWKKVVKVAESYRNKYDELLTTVNKVLEDNGFPPIPKRSDYFPHYEEIDGLMKKFGFDMNNNALPTDINGLTDNFKPNKQFFANALRRKGDETTFGAIQGFDRYLEGISNVIYHTKNIRQLRALDDVIRTKYEGNEHLSNFASKLTEYTNLLAGKKSRIDRSVEDAFGRKVYNVVDTIRRRTGANIVGANISSALTNFIPLTHSLATTSKPAFVKGLTETLANIGKNDGFIQKSDFLTKRIGSDPLYRNLWDKTVNGSMWLMRTFDSFTSQVIVRGKYNELISKGVPEEQAIKQADDWANKIIAGRGKGDMPTLFGSKTFGIVSQFQLEVNNQLSFLFKDLPRNSPNKAALASAVGQILLYSYLFNNLYEKAVGRRPAFDPVGIAFQTVKDYNNDNLTKGEATKNLGTNIANQLPFTSVFTGGRFPISAGMPDVGGIATGKANWTDEAVKPLLYLGLPTGGGQLKKFVEGMTAMNKNPLSPQGTTGVYQGDKLKFPVENSIGNNIRGPLFGKYSFPEAQDFYDNSRSALSAKQTQQVEINPEMYKYILEQQRLKRLKKQMQGK